MTSACTTVGKPSAGSPPTRREGDSGAGELRMRLLEGHELAHEAVELGVGDLRAVLHVVEPLVAAQLVAQLFDARSRRGGRRDGRRGRLLRRRRRGLFRHRAHATVTAMSAAKVRVLALALLAAASAATLRAQSFPAAGGVVPDHLPPRHREENRRGHGGPGLEEHDLAPGGDAAAPPVPERLPQHALDLLARVGRRAPRRVPAEFVGLDRDHAHDGPRRRGPAAGDALHRARRRQPGRPDRRRGHPAPARAARRNDLGGDGLRLAAAARVGAHRLQGRLLHGRAVVPEDRRLRGEGLELPPVPRVHRVLLGFRQLRRLDRRPRALQGQGRRHRAARRRARDLGRARPLPVPPAGRARLRVDGRPELHRARGRLPRGRRGRRAAAALPAARAREPGRALLRRGQGRPLGLRPHPRRRIPTPPCPSWIRPGGRTARAAWSIRR